MTRSAQTSTDPSEQRITDSPCSSLPLNNFPSSMHAQNPDQVLAQLGTLQRSPRHSARISLGLVALHELVPVQSIAGPCLTVGTTGSLPRDIANTLDQRANTARDIGAYTHMTNLRVILVWNGQIRLGRVFRRTSQGKISIRLWV